MRKPTTGVDTIDQGQGTGDLLGFQLLEFQAAPHMRISRSRVDQAPLGVVYLAAGGYPDIAETQRRPVNSAQERVSVRHAENRGQLVAGPLPGQGWLSPAPWGTTQILPDIAQPAGVNVPPKKSRKGRDLQGSVRSEKVTGGRMLRTWER